MIQGVVVETHPDGQIVRVEVGGFVGYHIVPEECVKLTGGQSEVDVGAAAEVLGDNVEFDTADSINNSPTLEDLLEEAWEE